MKHSFILLILLSQSSGCFPWHSTFYEPSNNNARVVLSECRGHVGFPNTLLYEHEGFSVDISSSLHGNSLNIKVWLTIPKSTNIILGSDRIVISDDSGVKSYIITELTGRRWETRRQRNPVAWLFGMRTELTMVSYTIPFNSRLLGDEYKYYSFSFKVEKPADSFVLKMPVITKGDKVIDLGPITYKKKSGWTIYPINC